MLAGRPILIGGRKETQSLQGAGDVLVGGAWRNSDNTAINLFSYIDEVSPNTADFIRYNNGVAGPDYVMRLAAGAVDPGIKTGFWMRWQARVSTLLSAVSVITYLSGAASLPLFVEDVQMGNDPGDPQNDFLFTSLDWHRFDYQLTAAQVNLIPWGDQGFEALFRGGGSAGVKNIDIAWFAFDIPGV